MEQAFEKEVGANLLQKYNFDRNRFDDVTRSLTNRSDYLSVSSKVYINLQLVDSVVSQVSRLCTSK